ncbi:hypothetical protein [Streptomyces sp. NBC_01012]|uniref:hypothetical protein n=1 Tax=Streptomyces sp. NBC_01012 TaxID=2903717 RepID=UPI0038689573|nr:hypothetical protein OG623_24640 [Streptomyces sp. NBC_01012]
MRRLSGTEAAFAHAHTLLRGSGRLTVSFAVDGALPPELIERAVGPWVRRLPSLSLRIEDTGDDGLRFCQGAPGPYSLPPPSAVSGTDDELAEGQRLWRLWAGHDRTGSTRFRLTLHPAICDGYSTGRFVRPLLDALLGASGGQNVRGRAQPLPPDTDTLTYEGGGPCSCGGCVPSAWPRPGARRSVAPYAGHEAGPGERRAGPGGGAADPVALTLTPYESRRLRDWCGARQLTVGGFLAAVLAGPLARETGRGEVTVATALSLRRRFAERALITEPGCALGVIRVPLRPVAGDDAVVGAGAHARALCPAVRAWRPDRRGHAGIRRAVERDAVDSGVPELRVTDAGSVDTVLGPHLRRVTGFRAAAASGDGPPGAALYLSSFRGALTVALTSRGLGPGWLRAAEQALAAAVYLRPADFPG